MSYYFDETIGLFDHLDQKQNTASCLELQVICGRGNGKSMRQLQWLMDHLAENAENSKVRYHKMFTRLQITNVIYNNPATVVFWSDGQKTVVKCGENDTFDPEKGLAMAISKRFLGNHGNYYNKIKKWLPVEEEEKKRALDACRILCPGDKSHYV